MSHQQYPVWLGVFIILFFVPIAGLYAQSVTIQYGTVTGNTTVTEESRHAGGALAGGALGALFGPNRHRGLRALAGAGIGASIQGSATGGTQQQYTVDLNNGGKTIINTELQDIKAGDCVAIEQGTYANIRRVSSVHCEMDTQVPEHHTTASNNCEMVKRELTEATTVDAVNLAATKVRVLCED